jgi:hypothetical protein
MRSPSVHPIKYPSPLAVGWCRVYLMGLLFYLVANTLLAQKTVERTGQYTMLLTRTSTIEASETACIEQARLAVIAKEFGVTVSETTVQKTTDINGESTSKFSVLTRTAVKGEWLSDSQAPLIEWYCENNNLFVKATVKGHIRELAKVGQTDIEFYTCAPGNLMTEKNTFREGESLNALFKASKEGYLSVYYIDHAAETVTRLLPAASGLHHDHVAIQADQTYILFNRNKAPQYPWGNMNTELQLSLPEGQTQAMDEVVAVFSTEPYQKPLLQILAHTTALAELSIVDFESWATDLKFRQTQAMVKRVSLSLTP